MVAELRERLLERTAGYRAWVAHGLGRPDLLPTPGRSQLGYRVTRRFARLPFPVHIIGLDSAWLAGDDHDARKLRLTDEQILRLCTGDDGEHLAGLRLALVHHPLADLADGERRAGSCRSTASISSCPATSTIPRRARSRRPTAASAISRPAASTSTIATATGSPP